MEKLSNGCGQIRYVSRIADLVGYHAQHFMFVGQSYYFCREIVTSRTVDPGCANNKKSISKVMGRHLLPTALGTAVRVNRSWLVPLIIRLFSLPIKDLIGRDIDHIGVGLQAAVGYVLGAKGVDSEGSIRVSGRAVNIGRGVMLTDFTREEASRFGAELDAPTFDRVMDWTAGHPYLTQAVCREVVERRQGTAAAGSSVALVEESVRDGSLDELLLENFSEVCNVMSRAFTGATAPSVTLGKIHHAPVAANDAGVEPEQDGSSRIDMNIDVMGYTKGEMTLIKL